MLRFLVISVLVCLGAMVSTTVARDRVEPVDQGISKAYINGVWSYTHIITGPRTDGEGTWGILIYREKVLGYNAAVNDYYDTPWGRIYWHGTLIRRLSGPHFWMPFPKVNRPEGRELDPEKAVEKLE